MHLLRRETRNDARATRCWNCDGEKEQLRDADSEGREAARRGQRAKEYAGRSLNALGAGTSLVPRAAQGVFERARVDVLVHWETQQLEQYTGAASQQGHLFTHKYISTRQFAPVSSLCAVRGSSWSTWSAVISLTSRAGELTGR